MYRHKDKTIDELLKPLRERYLRDVRSHRTKLQLFLSAKKDQLSDVDFERMLYLVHKVYGSGASFGFSQITETGFALEQLLGQFPRPLQDEIITHLRRFIKVCDEAAGP